jgi:predicted helicase
MDDFWRKEEKLAWFSEHDIQTLDFENITPDKNNNWINNDEFNELIPLADKAVKAGQSKEAIFKLFCWGNSSNRDEWVYDFNYDTLEKKMVYFSETFNSLLKVRKQNLPNTIKWSTDLKSKLSNSKGFTYESNKSIIAFWRPFTKKYFYSEKIINDRLTDNHYQIFGPELDKGNFVLMITNHPQTEFLIHSVNRIADAGYGSRGTQMFALYRYDSNGNRTDNITEWALQLFQEHYQQIEPSSPVCYANSPEVREEFKIETAAPKPITKEAIFHYVYAVLHNPAYRKKYELNLKREFPRIPLYENFWQWAKWGEQLMNLHINYETAAPYPLQQKEIATKEHPKAKLRAIKEDGIIVLDDNTELHGIPSIAWEYKLGNRSALEWILDQYKEKKPKDPTIAEKFNSYKFADYKEHVIDLLKRVCTVSVETMKVVGEMEGS